MADSSIISTPLEPQPKKRKLRYPRTANACQFCRRRKVRCSGTYPCEMCLREDTVCEYAGGLPNVPTITNIHQAPVASTPVASTPVASSSNSTTPHLRKELVAPVELLSRPASVSRRNSMDPPQTFGENHIGPTSGVSFLYGQWVKGSDSEPKSGNQGSEHVDAIPHAPLASWGDLPQVDSAALSALPEPVFTVEQISDILDKYFTFISPTYRFLHHHTVKQWATALVSRSKLSAAREACIQLVCAQTLLHSPATPDEPNVVGHGDPRLSLACFEKAKTLLDNEPGPPSLASVQSRIALCLYHLSTFRLNECRYCFSFAVTVATTLGIHRRQSSSTKVNTLEAESRKRTFWSMYVLDGYLSVMLGRPRLLRDEDVDQPFPSNISDSDLMSLEPLEDLPRHGDLEAFIAHSRLAKLMARGNDELYPLYHLSNDQILQRSGGMITSLSRWQDDLPKFLQARKKTFTGQRTFERQNTILKLAWAHARVLATRRCILMNFAHVENSISQSQEAAIEECIAAIVMILETVEALIENGQCYGSFWSTQYIALVAISTLYVLIIQGRRSLSIEEYFEKARNCHDHLATLPPPGSQAQRHHILLSHLRSKAERSFTNTLPRGTPAAAQQPDSSMKQVDKQPPRPPITNSYPHDVNNESGPPNDMLTFGSMLTPNSTSDGFQYMLNFGWESLDTIGASIQCSGEYSSLL